MASLVDEFGAKEVGRLYAVRTLERLYAMGTDLAELDDDDLGWIDYAAAFAFDLDPEQRLRMVIAAANEADDDRVFWIIGDQPAAHLSAVPGFARRLHEAREVNPNVDRLFRLMQAYYRLDGHSDAGWWDDGCSYRADD